MEEKILKEYLALLNTQDMPDFMLPYFTKVIKDAIKENPKINCGEHFYDYLMMTRDCPMEEFYGEDYFE